MPHRSGTWEKFAGVPNIPRLSGRKRCDFEASTLERSLPLTRPDMTTFSVLDYTDWKDVEAFADTFGRRISHAVP